MLLNPFRAQHLCLNAVCMEMSWKGNADHKPYPGDQYYFYMKTLDNQDIDEEAMIDNTWWRLCECVPCAHIFYSLPPSLHFHFEGSGIVGNLS